MSASSVFNAVPILDTIIFYVLFVIVIPYYFIVSDSLDALKLYLPTIVMIAITLTTAGDPHYFQDLYPTTCYYSIAGLISKTIINMYTSIKLAIVTNNISLGIMSAMISLIITFPLAQVVLPFFINEGHDAIHRTTNTAIHSDNSDNWDKYLIGAVYIMLLMSIQYCALMATYNYYLGNL
jgi:hypothetical protein